MGVRISATTYDEAVRWIVDAAATHVPGIVSAFPVHGVVTASRDPSLREKVNRFDIVTPDGQPVRWALNFLYRTRLKDRVYGPELMVRICRRAEEERIPVYLYGSHPDVLSALRRELRERFPGLRIAGSESPPFRPLTEQEDRDTVARIDQSGARIVFLGLGCPKQDHFAHDHRTEISAIQVCVGAAFDFLSGNKKTAPGWMQRNGLEWLFRLAQEPGRLWKRYVFTNLYFLIHMVPEAFRRSSRRGEE